MMAQAREEGHAVPASASLREVIAQFTCHPLTLYNSRKNL